MAVNHFGPYTLDEELEMRIETLSNEILRAYEACEDARRKLDAAAASILQLKKLQADYIGVAIKTANDPNATQQKWFAHNKKLETRIAAILNPEHN